MNKLLILFALLFPTTSFAQKLPCDSIYRYVDKMPVYKSRPADLFQDIRSINFAKDCHAGELRQIMWTIDASGQVADIEVTGPEEECKPYLIEQLKKFNDNWVAGRHRGMPVCVKIGIVIKSHIN